MCDSDPETSPSDRKESTGLEGCIRCEGAAKGPSGRPRVPRWPMRPFAACSQPDQNRGDLSGRRVVSWGRRGQVALTDAISRGPAFRDGVGVRARALPGVRTAPPLAHPGGLHALTSVSEGLPGESTGWLRTRERAHADRAGFQQELE